MKRAILFVFALFGLAIVFATADNHTSHSEASPAHVAAVFFDGIDHGDYRQACSVWEAARSNMQRCESGLTVQMATSAYEGIFGGYVVVPHSVKRWRTGAIWYANVQVAYMPTGGEKIVAHMRKRAGGDWYVWYVA